MRTVRVLVSAASVAALVALVAACGETPIAAEPPLSPPVRASATLAPAPSDSLAGFDVAGSLEEQPADTTGTRRGGQIAGGGN